MVQVSATRATEQTLQSVVSTLNNLVGQVRNLAVDIGGENLPDLTGQWGYNAGTSGTLTLSGGKRVLTISAISVAGGSATVNGGDPITIPAGGTFVMEPRVQVVDPEVVFTGTDSYVVDWLEG